MKSMSLCSPTAASISASDGSGARTTQGGGFPTADDYFLLALTHTDLAGGNADSCRASGIRMEPPAVRSGEVCASTGRCR